MKMLLDDVIRHNKKHHKDKGAKRAPHRSSLEAIFDQQLMLCKIKPTEIEYKFHSERMWRFDYAWPEIKLALEIEGGSWKSKSRHTSGIGFLSDCEKYDEAMRLGWNIYRAHGDFVRSGRAIETLKILLEMRRL